MQGAMLEMQAVLSVSGLPAVWTSKAPLKQRVCTKQQSGSSSWLPKCGNPSQLPSGMQVVSVALHFVSSASLCMVII